MGKSIHYGNICCQFHPTTSPKRSSFPNSLGYVEYRVKLRLTYLKLTNPKSKSKSKSRLTTGFSLKSEFPTTHPPDHPPGKVSKKQDTEVYPKQKLLVYFRRLWNMFWNKPRPKNHPLGLKKDQKPCNQRIL